MSRRARVLALAAWRFFAVPPLAWLKANGLTWTWGGATAAGLAWAWWVPVSRVYAWGPPNGHMAAPLGFGLLVVYVFVWGFLNIPFPAWVVGTARAFREEVAEAEQDLLAREKYDASEAAGAVSLPSTVESLEEGLTELEQRFLSARNRGSHAPRELE